MLITSLSVLPGKLLFATKIKIASPIFPIGAKSLIVSKLTLLKTFGLMTIVPSKANNKV